MLAGCLRRLSNPTRALRYYEELRRERTARIQLAARNNETVFHLPNGPDQRDRDRGLAATSGQHTVHRNSWLFGYDVDQVMATDPAPHDPRSRQRGVTGSDVTAIPGQPARARFGAGALATAVLAASVTITTGWVRTSLAALCGVSTIDA